MNEELFLEYNLPKELSQFELKECFKKMSEGDIDSRNKIIEHNIRLVFYRVSNRFKMIWHRWD